MFRYADKNSDKTLSLKEIIGLLKHLNIEIDHDQAKQRFEVKLFFIIILCKFCFSAVN